MYSNLAFADIDGSNVKMAIYSVEDYSNTIYEDRVTAEDCVRGLLDIVNDSGTSWGYYAKNNNYTQERHWRSDSIAGGQDNYYVDDVDLAAYAGHGLIDSISGNKFVFNSMMEYRAVPSSRMSLGDRDAEWVLAFTCHFTYGAPSTYYYGWVANGVHLINGYATDMTITANGGNRFSYWAKYPYGVRVAWYKYGRDTQDGSDYNSVKTFGAIASVNDFLWGYGSVSADPAQSYRQNSSLYTSWTTKLNFE